MHMPHFHQNDFGLSGSGGKSAASLFLRSQFARVVKGVDLRSTARKCAWVRTPQLTERSGLSILCVDQQKKECSHAGLNRGPYGY